MGLLLPCLPIQIAAPVRAARPHPGVQIWVKVQVLLYLWKVRISSRVRVSRFRMLKFLCSEEWRRGPRKEGDASTAPAACLADPAFGAEKRRKCEEGVAVAVGWGWKWREYEFGGDIRNVVDFHASTCTNSDSCGLYTIDCYSCPTNSYLSFVVFCTFISVLTSQVIFTRITRRSRECDVVERVLSRWR
jgi:hypothetical protein